MRTSDIWQAKQNPSYVMTEKLYVDTDVPVEQMSLEEAKRGMCAAAGNDVLKCESCSARCKFGRRIVELLKPVEMERTEKKMDRTKAVEAMNAKRKQKSTKAYLSAIASGAPRQWFVDNGYEPKNAMVRLNKNYAGVTQEEAKRRLVEMGEVVEKKPEAPAEQPVFKARLKVSAVDGLYFTYSMGFGKLKMTSEYGTALVDVENIADMCAEIVQALEVLKAGTIG